MNKDGMKGCGCVTGSTLGTQNLDTAPNQHVGKSGIELAAQNAVRSVARLSDFNTAEDVVGRPFTSQHAQEFEPTGQSLTGSPAPQTSSIQESAGNALRRLPRHGAAGGEATAMNSSTRMHPSPSWPSSGRADNSAPLKLGASMFVGRPSGKLSERIQSNQASTYVFATSAPSRLRPGAHLLSPGYTPPYDIKDVPDPESWPRGKMCGWKDTYRIAIQMTMFVTWRTYEFEFTTEDDGNAKLDRLLRDLNSLLGSDAGPGLLKEHESEVARMVRQGQIPMPNVATSLSGVLSSMGFGKGACVAWCPDGTGCEFETKVTWSTIHQIARTGQSNTDVTTAVRNGKNVATVVVSFQYAVLFEVHFEAMCTCGWI